MAGRPPLRLGQHGKVRRIELGKGLWVARCRYRDTDGVTRVVERQSPIPGQDQWGKQAEDALLDALHGRRPPGTAGEVTAGTKVIDLANRHIDTLTEDAAIAPATTETYRAAARKLAKFLGGLRVDEATPPRIDAALRSMKNAHGQGMARHARVIMRGGLQLAVMAGVVPVNPARDVSPLKRDRPKGAPQLTEDQVAGLLDTVAASPECEAADMGDPIIMLMATGLRRSELLALRWSDYNQKAGEIAITGKVVRIKGVGLKRFDTTKTAAGRRTLRLPAFAVDMLKRRRAKDFVGEQVMIFPSAAGTWRDPSNFGRDLRKVRDALGLSDVTSHSFRKTVATLIDDEGLSARVGADQLGHAKVSMTQDVYMARGRVHASVADLLDRRTSPS